MDERAVAPGFKSFSSRIISADIVTVAVRRVLTVPPTSPPVLCWSFLWQPLQPRKSIRQSEHPSPLLRFSTLDGTGIPGQRSRYEIWGQVKVRNGVFQRFCLKWMSQMRIWIIEQKKPVDDWPIWTEKSEMNERTSTQVSMCARLYLMQELSCILFT